MGTRITKMLGAKNCPSCGIPWEREERIYETLRNHPGYREWTDEELAVAASHYGDTPETPEHFGINVVVKVLNDRADEVHCLNCKDYFPV